MFVPKGGGTLTMRNSFFIAGWKLRNDTVDRLDSAVEEY